MPRLTARLAVVVLLLAALALGATACGSGDDASSGADADATALLRDTFGADHPIRSGRLDATLDLDLRGLAQLSQPLNLHLSGPFQSRGGTSLPDFALDVDFQGDKPITVGAVFAQGGGFLTIEGQAFDLGPELYASFKQGYEKAKRDAAAGATGSKGQPTLAALGISPLRWLKDPRNQGTEDIAGTPTVHIASGVDVGRLLEDVSTVLGKARGVTGSAGGSVPAQLSAQQREAITRSIKRAKVDVWTGAKDHTLRKVAVDLDVDVPQDLRGQAGNLRTGHVILQVTIAQLNQRQTIRKPSGARPLSELRSALQQLGLVGGSSSGGTGTAPDASTTAPPASSATATTGADDYTQCLAAAGEDLAKVQGCAKYLK
jgi:hypothetical protein